MPHESETAVTGRKTANLESRLQLQKPGLTQELWRNASLRCLPRPFRNGPERRTHPEPDGVCSTGCTNGRLPRV